MSIFQNDVQLRLENSGHLQLMFNSVEEPVKQNFYKTMSKDVSCGRGKDVTLFQKGDIIGLHQAEITGIGIRTVQRIIKARKDSGEPSTLRKKCGREKISNDRDQR